MGKLPDLFFVFFLFFCFLLCICSFVGIFSTLIYWWGLIKYDFPFKENNNSEAYYLYYLIIISLVLTLILILYGLIIFISYFLEDPNFFISLGIFLIVLHLISLVFVLGYSTNNKCRIIHEKGTNYGKNSSQYIKWYEKYKDINISEFNKMRCENRNFYLLIFFILWILSPFYIYFLGLAIPWLCL